MSYSRSRRLASQAPRVLLEEVVAASDSTIEFTDFVNDAYTRYELEIDRLLLSIDSHTPYLRLSSDNGVSWVSAANYDTNMQYSHTTNSASNGSASATALSLSAGSLGNLTTDGGLSGQFEFINLNEAVWTDMIGQSNYGDVTPTQLYNRCHGRLEQNVAMDGIQIYTSGALITSGTFRLYGRP